MADWIALIHSVNKNDTPTTIESHLAHNHHANKGGFTNLAIAHVYASSQQAVLGPLLGSS